MVDQLASTCAHTVQMPVYGLAALVAVAMVMMVEEEVVMVVAVMVMVKVTVVAVIMVKVTVVIMVTAVESSKLGCGQVCMVAAVVPTKTTVSQPFGATIASRIVHVRTADSTTCETRQHSRKEPTPALLRLIRPHGAITPPIEHRAPA